MRSQPHPFPSGKLVHPAPGMPQHVLLTHPAEQIVKPAASQPSAPSVEKMTVPLQPMQAPQGACFNCGQPGPFAR